MTERECGCGGQDEELGICCFYSMLADDFFSGFVMGTCYTNLVRDTCAICFTIVVFFLTFVVDFAHTIPCFS